MLVSWRGSFSERIWMDHFCFGRRYQEHPIPSSCRTPLCRCSSRHRRRLSLRSAESSQSDRTCNENARDTSATRYEECRNTCGNYFWSFKNDAVYARDVEDRIILTQLRGEGMNRACERRKGFVYNKTTAADGGGLSLFLTGHGSCGKRGRNLSRLRQRFHVSMQQTN